MGCDIVDDYSLLPVVTFTTGRTPQKPQFKPQWFQSVIHLVMYKFYSWTSLYSSADRTGHFVGATDEDAEP